MKTNVLRLIATVCLVMGAATASRAAIPVPDFTLPNDNGSTYRLAESRDKEVVILFAWASW